MTYRVLLFLHIVSFVAWMAGLFYLPRLFVYHTRALDESKAMLILMEKRLLEMIMTPSMIATWGVGLALAWQRQAWVEGWFFGKCLGVLALTFFHFKLLAWHKEFACGGSFHTERFFRIVNEVPTVLLLYIVFLAVFKPF